MLVLFTLSVMKGSLGESIHDSGGSGGAAALAARAGGSPVSVSFSWFMPMAAMLVDYSSSYLSTSAYYGPYLCTYDPCVSFGQSAQ